MIGTAFAYRDGLPHLPTALLCLLAAITIQIGTNLANDYFDCKKGADTSDRIGPVRVTAQGLVAPETMKRAFILAFGLAAALSIPLILRGGWPILIVAILSILSGILYTAGPRSLGYLGLGEIFVLIFFGPVAVGGTYYVQSLQMDSLVILEGFGPGFFSMAILVVNNLRDIESDRRSGKKTLAVRFGRTFAKVEYVFAVLAAYLIPILTDFRWIFSRIYFSWKSALANVHAGISDEYFLYLLRLFLVLLSPVIVWIVMTFFSFPCIHAVLKKSDGPSLNRALAYTSFLLMLYSILYSIGLQWPLVFI